MYFVCTRKNPVYSTTQIPTLLCKRPFVHRISCSQKFWIMNSSVARACARNILANRTSGLTKHTAYFSKTSEQNVKQTRNLTTEFTSVDPSEVEKFRSLSAGWWNQNGDFKALHSLNEIRVPLIRDGIISANGASSDITAFPLSNCKILDVGCGGGILSEALGRLGANVTGVDVGHENITVANYHVNLNPEVKDKISYIEGSVEQCLSDEQVFDAIVVSEVLEHVLQPKQFMNILLGHLRPGGSVFITTINRNTISWLLGIVAAEYLLRIVPPGTHDWNKFLTPQEVKEILNVCNVNVSLVHGMFYNVLTNTWSWSSDTTLNYAMHGVKALSCEIKE